MDRLLDIFHIKITHLLVKSKLRYFCNATFVLMYYLVLHCVSSCLVFGRECNDDQSLLIWEIYAAICHTIAHQLLCLKPSVVLVVSPIWAGSFRTQGQGNSHCTIISEIYNNCSDFQLANKWSSEMTLDYSMMLPAPLRESLQGWVKKCCFLEKWP